MQLKKILIIFIFPFLMIVFFILLTGCVLFMDVDNKDITAVSGLGTGTARLVPLIIGDEIAYRDVSSDFITGWLREKDSALATKDFATACIEAGEKYNINPLLLVAITGQEQSFCPEGSSSAMLRNPWNVFGSWQNTKLSVAESAMYAAECISRLSQNRPANIHPIAWLNSRENPAGMYATDLNWWTGVSCFFREISGEYGGIASVSPGNYTFPIQDDYWISSPFGEMRRTGPHSGVDFACSMGTPIYAVTRGIVSGLQSGDPIGGNQVWISGWDGRIYTYWHCSHFAEIQTGEIVETGRLIAYVGSTGHSTGPHLHLGIMENTQWIDPMKILNQN